MLQITEGIQNPKKYPDTWTFWSSWRKTTEMKDIESFSF